MYYYGLFIYNTFNGNKPQRRDIVEALIISNYVLMI